MYDRLDAYSRRSMKGDAVILRADQWAIACETMADKLASVGVKLTALSVGAMHYHILAQFGDANIRHWVGLAKKHSSFMLSRAGLPGRVWAKRCRAAPIRDRSHQVNTYEYIAAHRRRGACVWTFREGLLHPA